jgi:hypothetical protein
MATIKIYPGAGWLYLDKSTIGIGHEHQTSGGTMIQNYSMLWDEIVSTGRRDV